MSSPITLECEGKRYTWDGQRWYGVDDYTVPPNSVLHKLHALLAPALVVEDDAITDPNELLSCAKRAQTSGDLPRARRLAERVYRSQLNHRGAAAVLCSVLRDSGRPEEALAIADRFSRSSYPPILTSRAAALCDLGRWQEALQQIRQVLAIGMKSRGEGSSEALAVHGRIKASAPELFE
jgi:hypothetical protein